MKTKKAPSAKTVETLTHDEASRKNIPTAEYQSVMRTIRNSYGGARMSRTGPI